MSKHTPGPWKSIRFQHYTGEFSFRVVPCDVRGEPRGEGPIAEVFEYIKREDEARANTRLMAAAPLMYEALELLDTILEFACGVRENESFVPQDPSLLNAAFEKARAALQAAKPHEVCDGK
jgi:hypothetical protein